MLNPFPELLNYGFFAPFILRVVVGLVFLDLGLAALKQERGSWIKSFTALKLPKPDAWVKALALIEIVGGAGIIVGFYTQVAAALLAVIAFVEIYLEYKDPGLIRRNFVFYFLLLGILLSLLLSGAGGFAFDLPL